MREWGSTAHMIMIVVFASLIVFCGLRDMNWIAAFFSAILVTFMCIVGEEKKCADCSRNCRTCEYKRIYQREHPEEFEEYGG